jgi:hypothetical protein
MYDPCSYVIVAGDVRQAEAALASACARLGRTVVDFATLGARHLAIWRAMNGLVVIELDYACLEPDLELARALSAVGARDAAAYVFSSRGDNESLALFHSGEPAAAYSLDDAAGQWTVEKAGRPLYFHDFHDGARAGETDEEHLERVKTELDGACDAAFPSSPLANLAAAEEPLNDVLEPDGSPPLRVSFVLGAPDAELVRIEAAGQRWLAPVLAELGFVRGRADSYDAVAYEAPAGERKLRVQLRDRLTVDVLSWSAAQGWISDAHEPLLPSDFLGRPPSPVDADAVAVAAAARLVRQAPELAARVPELADALAKAAHSSAWKTAVENQEARVRDAFEARRRKTGWRRAEIVFRGAKLLLVETEDKERFTFKLDTAGVPSGVEVAVGDILEQPTGGPRARQLRVGTRVYYFEESGAFVRSDD